MPTNLTIVDSHRTWLNRRSTEEIEMVRATVIEMKNLPYQQSIISSGSQQDPYSCDDSKPTIGDTYQENDISKTLK